MAKRSKKGAAGAAIGELGIIKPSAPPPAPEPADPEPPAPVTDTAAPRPPAIEPEAPVDEVDDGAGLQELDELLADSGHREEARDGTDRDGDEAIEPKPGSAPRPNPPLATPTRLRRRRRQQPAMVRSELNLPEDLLFRARSLVRPKHTGGRRSLGASFTLQAYVRAVDELIEQIDVNGIHSADDEDEMVERVKDALRLSLAPERGAADRSSAEQEADAA